MAVKPCSRWNHYRLVDWLTQGYLAIVGLPVLILREANRIELGLLSFQFSVNVSAISGATNL